MANLMFCSEFLLSYKLLQLLQHDELVEMHFNCGTGWTADLPETS